MEFFYIYLLFALTTALSSLYEFFLPIIKSVRHTHPEAMISRNWKSALFALVLGAAILAPIMTLITFVPKMNTKFRNTLEQELVKE